MTENIGYFEVIDDTDRPSIPVASDVTVTPPLTPENDTPFLNAGEGPDYVITDVNNKQTTIPANTPSDGRPFVMSAAEKLVQIRMLKRFIQERKRSEKRAAIKACERNVRKTRNRKHDKVAKAARKRNRHK